MKKFLNYIYRNLTFIFKGLIFASALLLIVYIFSQNGQFQYDYSVNKVWTYNDLVAPFDFTIKKSDKAVKNERDSIKNNIPLFVERKPVNTQSILSKLNRLIAQSNFDDDDKNLLNRQNNVLISRIFKSGIIKDFPKNYRLKSVNLIQNKHLTELPVHQIYDISKIHSLVSDAFSNRQDLADYLNGLYDQYLPINLSINNSYRQAILQQSLENISLNKGLVTKGQMLIKKGELITPQKFDMLNSLKQMSQRSPDKQYHKYLVSIGYGVLVAMVLLMLLLFLKKYKPEIYANNVKISLIVFNMLLVILLTSFTIRHYPGYVFVVPLVILPLILKAFFDARVALFVHILTVLLLGFIVSNSFEFMFLQIMAGIVSVLTVSELTKRANLFTSVGSIILVYLIGYLSFHLIYEGNFASINYEVLLQFLLNGLLAIALSHQLILVYEKLFGLVSDVSLLELSNTNSKLIKRLADKAPGTFNHSMQVANLAEAAANEINANSLLVRAGAIYHDIGKMLNPFYFTENQTSGVNYHDNLPPEESARIIIQHVLDGIELARKNNIPDRIIDFIRTHHGRGLVQYFYKKALEENPDVDIEKFRYPGPNPFSKETAVLMMADSVEAASKSLREPTAEKIDNFVDKIIDHQLQSGLLDNANITLKEISAVKKLFKKKLKNIYHLRIEYPE